MSTAITRAVWRTHDKATGAIRKANDGLGNVLDKSVDTVDRELGGRAKALPKARALRGADGIFAIPTLRGRATAAGRYLGRRGINFVAKTGLRSGQFVSHVAAFGVAGTAWVAGCVGATAAYVGAGAATIAVEAVPTARRTARGIYRVGTPRIARLYTWATRSAYRTAHAAAHIVAGTADRAAHFVARTADRAAHFAARTADRGARFAARSADRGARFAARTADRVVRFADASFDRGVAFAGRSFSRSSRFVVSFARGVLRGERAPQAAPATPSTPVAQPVAAAPAAPTIELSGQATGASSPAASYVPRSPAAAERTLS